MASTASDFGFGHWPVDDGRGVSCDGRGAFIGTVPLLQRQTGRNGRDVWAVRPSSELNAALSQHYGLPIDMTDKLDGLSEVADSLNRGDMFQAQLGALDLKLPAPLPAGNIAFGRHVANLAMQLHDSGMLDNAKAAKSSRDAAANSNSRQGTDAGLAANSNLLNPAPPFARPQYRFPFIPAQAIPLEIPLDLPWMRPFELPIPRTAPMPGPSGEAAPVPFELPGYRATRRPVGNPFPNDPECCREWGEAAKECFKLLETGNLGHGSGFGKDYEDCLMGMVTEKCGGNEIEDAPKKGNGIRA